MLITLFTVNFILCPFFFFPPRRKRSFDDNFDVSLNETFYFSGFSSLILAVSIAKIGYKNNLNTYFILLKKLLFLLFRANNGCIMSPSMTHSVFVGVYVFFMPRYLGQLKYTSASNPGL